MKSGDIAGQIHFAAKALSAFAFYIAMMAKEKGVVFNLPFNYLFNLTLNIRLNAPFEQCHSPV
ncbi:MAG: hypothetical protein JSS76_19770 [Bacteroidetes bacterium]|nr:hypothetical protein [Bacteroidota bacterium]